MIVEDLLLRRFKIPQSASEKNSSSKAFLGGVFRFFENLGKFINDAIYGIFSRSIDQQEIGERAELKKLRKIDISDVTQIDINKFNDRLNELSLETIKGFITFESEQTNNSEILTAKSKWTEFLETFKETNKNESTEQEKIRNIIHLFEEESQFIYP